MFEYRMIKKFKNSSTHDARNLYPRIRVIAYLNIPKHDYG